MKTIRCRFRHAILCFPLIASLLICSPAHAVLGVADSAVVYDPTNYQQLMAIWNQAVMIWNTAKSTLQTLETVQNTIERAQEGYELIKNFDLQQAAKNVMSGNISGATNKFGAARSLMNTTEGKISSNVGFVSYQTQKIGDLKNIDSLLNQSAKNIDKAGGQTRQEANTKITAQSTAVVATLIAAEHERHIMQDMEAAKHQQNLKDMNSGLSTVYDAIGKAQ